MKRIQWIDIAKAIGIVAVVIGHFTTKGSTFYESLYWWTMPLFFMIGGFFVRPLHINELPQFLTKKVWPQLKQYFGYGLLLITVSFIIEQHDIQFTLTYLLRLLYGGTLLNGYLSVFWFTTVYLGSLLVVSLLRGYLPLLGQASVMLFLFWLGTRYQDAEAIFGHPLPGNLDLTLIAAPYMFVGWFLFHYRQYWLGSVWVIGLAAAIFGFLFVTQDETKLNFFLFMKSHHITHPMLSMLVPPILVIGILNIAFALENTRFATLLASVGKKSLPIMYMHKAVGYALGTFMAENLFIWVAAGVLVPLLLLTIAERGKRMMTRLTYD
ncbi:acyltransferase family protein [Lacticaseibacillus saniviri]|uniref:Acyltransferase 3 n=2 Tax=Lacticaseibacillus saniviri TaxID=931533 RepID=A0A0R2MVI4_9LACO|nr:acyltransferase family protein [Lacticaseibacillus saniviri]KRO16908.1 acyltransferase 3 [Lacticaseibacillus saniviri JCM 17471 = DSM 24301]MCG4282552.1 acyltransferase family protein [Lacticaseibacillus saniviri]